MGREEEAVAGEVQGRGRVRSAERSHNLVTGIGISETGANPGFNKLNIGTPVSRLSCFSWRPNALLYPL